MSLSPDGSLAITIIEGCHLWDTATGKELPWKDPETAKNMKKCEGNAVYWPDGSHIWVSDFPRGIRAVNMMTHKMEEDVIPTESYSGWVLRLSPEMKSIATARVLYDVSTKRPIFEFKEQGDQGEVDFGHDGKTMITRGEEGRTGGFKGISLWNLETQKVAHTVDFKEDTDFLANQFLACSPTANVFAVRNKTGNDSVVEIRDLESTEVKATFGKGWKLTGGSLTWSPDGKFLTVAVSRELPDGFTTVNEVWLLEAASGKPVARLEPARDEVERVAFSGDGSKLAILAPNPQKDHKMDLMLWDLTQLPK